MGTARTPRPGDRRRTSRSPGRSAASGSTRSSKRAAEPFSRDPGTPKLLSGGNPQIPKGDGDAPVQAYLDAMPGWTQAVGRRLDALVTRAVPGVRKAVRWNSPFYGTAERDWFLSFHVFTKYVKVSFFQGASLSPMPPGASKVKGTRYLDVREDEPLDEAQFTKWVKQASRLPGWDLT